MMVQPTSVAERPAARKTQKTAHARVRMVVFSTDRVSDLRELPPRAGLFRIAEAGFPLLEVCPHGLGLVRPAHQAPLKRLLETQSLFGSRKVGAAEQALRRADRIRRLAGDLPCQRVRRV